MGREGWKNGGGGSIPCACVPLRGIELETANVRREGEVGSPEERIVRGRELVETADPLRACLAAELDTLVPRGVVTLSNLVESPTVDKDEGSCEGRCETGTAGVEGENGKERCDAITF